MTAVQWEIEAKIDSVEAMLLRVEAALSPTGMSAFLRAEVGVFLQERAKSRFASEGDPAVGGAWLPLAPATQAIRASGEWNVGPAHPINVRTGELERYITGDEGITIPSGLGATLQYPAAPPTGAVARKVETAQRGMGKTPARPVLGVDATDMLFVLTRLAFFVQEAAL